MSTEPHSRSPSPRAAPDAGGDSEVIALEGSLKSVKDLDEVLANVPSAEADAALAANLAHLGLRDTGDPAENVRELEAYTRLRYYPIFKLYKNFSGLPADGILPCVRNVVTERSPRAPLTPPGFRGALYPPQAAVLRRMFDLETAPMRLACRNTASYINFGLLEERCAFGKTFLLAALATRGVPPPPNARTAEGLTFEPILGGNSDDASPVCDATVVVCSGRVAAEFCETAARFTDLPCVRVHSAASLAAVAGSPLPAGPALFVVKDGETTWCGTLAPTLTHFAAAARAAAGGTDPRFARVAFDDFDLLKLPPGASLPAARFYWLTSATGNLARPRGKQHGDFGRLKECVPSINAFSKVCCSVDYSAVEFNLPRPEYWTTPLTCRAAATALARGEAVPRATAYPGRVDAVLFGRGPVAPPPPGAPPKILACDVPVLDTDERRELRAEIVAALEADGVAALALTRANVNRFAREPFAVGVASLLHGVNMGYLTHIVVAAGSFTEAEVAQIIGRGQRLGRETSLQVYIAEGDRRGRGDFDDSDDGDSDDEDGSGEGDGGDNND